MGTFKILSNKRVNRWPYFDERWKLDMLVRPTRKIAPLKDYIEKYSLATDGDYSFLKSMSRRERRRFCLAQKRLA